jgi:hypothetical protein
MYAGGITGISKHSLMPKTKHPERGEMHAE